MAQPLTATHRLEIDYTQSGKLHKLRQYCAAVPWVITPGDYALTTRTGATPIEAAVAAQAIAVALGNLFATTIGAMNFTLAVRAGGIFNPIQFGPLVASGTYGSYVPAGQVTMVLRDTAVFKLKVIVLESGDPVGFHTTALSGLNTNQDAFAKFWDASGTDTARPWLWAQ